MAGTRKKGNYNQVTTHKKPKQQLTKITNIRKTKSNKTKARFRSPFTSSGQETDQAYCKAHRAHTGLILVSDVCG